MFKVVDNNISLYSGEDGVLKLEVEDYILQSGDYAMFSAREVDAYGNRGELLAQFIVEPEDTATFIFPFGHEDTEEYPAGTYAYQVEMVLSTMHRAIDVGEMKVYKAVRQG